MKKSLLLGSFLALLGGFFIGVPMALAGNSPAYPIGDLSGFASGNRPQISPSVAGYWPNYASATSGTIYDGYCGTVGSSGTELNGGFSPTPGTHSFSANPNFASFNTTVCGVGDYWIDAYKDGIGVSFVAHWDGANWTWSAPGTYLLNSIKSTTPTSGSLVATSTSGTVGATGAINSASYASGASVNITITNDAEQQAAVASPSLLGQSFTFPLSGSGTFSVSTSTANFLTVGQYTMSTTLTVPEFQVLGFSLGSTILAATTTSFTVGTTTAWDVFQNTSVANIQTAIENYSSSTCAVFSGNFQLGDCIVSLVVPQASDFSAYSQLVPEMEQVFPISYLTSIAQTWASLQASSTMNAPEYDLNLSQFNSATGTPFSTVLPNFDAFSSSTVEQYFPSGLFNVLKTLAGIAIILGLFYDIFFTVRNMIRT